jgi:hypothetical protein
LSFSALAVHTSPPAQNRAKATWKHSRLAAERMRKRENERSCKIC